MADDSSGFDPYEAVLADLRAKREQIDQAIAAIESLRGGASIKAAAPLPAAPTEGPGAFLGMTIVEASKALLKAKRQPLKNADLVVGLQAGGLVMQSSDPVNTVGSVLTRRFNDVGDVVRVARGTWGLKDWYPNRNFKKEAKSEEPEKSASVTTDEGVKRAESFLD